MNQKNKAGLYGFLCGMLCMAAIGGLINVVSTRWWVLERTTAEPGSVSARSKVSELVDIIEEHYMGEYATEDLTETMYKGLVAGLQDPYSYYYTSEEYTAELQESAGYYEGIGVTMEQDRETGKIAIKECMPEGPAERAGLKAGDVFVKAAGKEVQGYSLSTVVSWIKQSKDKKVELVIQREGEEELLAFNVETEEIVTKSVTSEMLEDGIGYLTINVFRENTSEQFAEHYAKLQAAGMKRMIIDLRENPGGLLLAVCDTLRQILPEGIIVYTEDKNGKREEYRCAGETPISIPLVLLINGHSASASEIFAGAVRDYGVATLVGEKSFGKGIVQRTFVLPGGSAVKLTIANYFTPKGENIHGIGIEPDVFAEPDPEGKTDMQLKKAIETVKTLF